MNSVQTEMNHVKVILKDPTILSTQILYVIRGSRPKLAYQPNIVRCDSAGVACVGLWSFYVSFIFK